MKNFKNILLNILLAFFSTVIILLIINVFTIYNLKQNNKFFNSTVSAYSKNQMSYLQRVFFPDTYDDFNNEYTMILGDSNTYGNGDSHLNGDYDYSIAHHLYKNKINVFNAALPGNDTPRSVLFSLYLFNLIENSFFVKASQPNKIIFFLYEGNDIHANEKDIYVKNFSQKTCSKFGSNFSIEGDTGHRLYNPSLKNNSRISLHDLIWESNLYGLKTLYMTLKHQINLKVQFGNLVSLLKFILPKNTYQLLKSKYGTSTEIKPEGKNKILLKNNEIKRIGTLQKPPLNLSEKEINKYFEILGTSLQCLHDKFKTKDKYLVYMPSPSSIYNFEENKIYTDAKNIDLIIDKRKIDNLSNFFEEKINNIAIKNNFKFHSLKPDLKKITKENILHGDIDRDHYNYLGYKSIAASVIKNIY